MKPRFCSDKDQWTTEGAKITEPQNLENVRRVIEDEGPIIVEHWFYRGASAPARLIFDDFDDFMQYLHDKVTAGDAVDVWNFGKTCTEKNRIASGKCPDDENRIPKKGPY
jgi:hypothetical protein